MPRLIYGILLKDKEGHFFQQETYKSRKLVEEAFQKLDTQGYDEKIGIFSIKILPITNQPMKGERK